MTKFHGRGKLLKHIDASVMTLIAERWVPRASRMLDLLARLDLYTKLANKLQKVLLDGVLIANECFHSRNRERMPSLICKLDLEKAYDRVDWDFLQYLLRRMHFGIKLRKWISEHLSLAMFPMLLNGSPIGFSLATEASVSGTP